MRLPTAQLQSGAVGRNKLLVPVIYGIALVREPANFRSVVNPTIPDELARESDPTEERSTKNIR